MSIISTDTARALGLDLARPDSLIPLSGVGGITSAPAFRVDRLAVMTEEGVELAWNDVQVIALDIDPSLDGVIGSDLLNSSREGSDGTELLGLLSSSAGAVEAVHFDFRNLDQPDGTGTLFLDLNSEYDEIQLELSALQAGDANQDAQFDQLDIVQVLRRGEYLSGQSATWGDGDWDGAPGGLPGDPPQGDGRFDQLDIVASLRHGLYLSGPYDALGGVGQSAVNLASVAEVSRTGDLAVVPEPSTLTLLTWVGLVLVGAWRWRRIGKSQGMAAG
jgi:hypothetical protein